MHPIQELFKKIIVPGLELVEGGMTGLGFTYSVTMEKLEHLQLYVNNFFFNLLNMLVFPFKVNINFFSIKKRH